jgi:ubiquinone/menaquinone biosynthesis C-methylase UbiE
MNQDLIKKTIEANIVLHTIMANEYSTCEPHFKFENVSYVEEKIKEIISRTNANNHLDLGCGTGFIINITKKYLNKIDGVDVTQAMLDKVDKSGSASITLHKCDTGSFLVDKEMYDIVTGYSFLHHLYDIRPTLITAYNALKKGGILYIDLDPNYYYWESINNLKRDEKYDPIIQREIEMVTYKDEDIEKKFGVSKDIFNQAEFGKNINGGFKEEDLFNTLKEIGFSKVEFFYYWYLGQSNILNNVTVDNFNNRFQMSDNINNLLLKLMPISRNLFKYIGFYATK